MFDRVFALPLNQRLLLYSGIAILLVLAYAFLLHLPRSAQITQNREHVQSLEQAKTQLQAAIKDPLKIKEEVAEVEGRFNEAKAQLPEQKEIPELLKQVSNLGRDSGLEVILFRQKAEAMQDLYAEVPVEMAVRGNYHQVVLFFDKVRALNRIVTVADTTMKNPQLAGGQIQIDASFSATTYRFLNEEERARVAKEKEEAAKKKGKK